MSRARTVAFMGIFCAVALVLGYVESLIPFNFGIPGVKLGLANLIVVFLLYYMKPIHAACVNGVRIVLSGLLFGNLFAILYSLAGAAVSFACMLPLSRLKKISAIGVSVAGGVTHNIGQLIVAMLVVGTIRIFYYIPVLLISGLVTGLVMGIIATLVIKNIKRIKFFDI